MSRILVIDREDRGLGTACILKESGCEVELVNRITDGMGRLYGSQPDLVLLSYELLPENGREACLQLLRACDIPVLVTGADSEKAIALLEAGADACLSEPLQALELVPRAVSLLRRRKQALAHKRRLRRLNGITRVEFRLLSCLVLSEGRLVETPAIIQQVWSGKQVSVQCLRFYVRRLRQRLAGTFADGQIINQRGLGYRYQSTASRA
ncbi:MAG: response regulator transcription factor [Dehalococcoidia bacterium]|nr:response regulator transcription factor [Dehalococcoidia bacterium]